MPALAGAIALLMLLAGCGEVEDDAPRDTTADDSQDAPDGADAGGGSDGGSVDLGDVEPAEAGSWTYLQYSMADSDLEPFLLGDIIEAASVGSQGDLNVVALVDRTAGVNVGEVLNIPDWSGGKLFHVLPDELVELADVGEVDMGDPATLAEFIEFGVTNFPADNYALTLSDHGGGWTGMGPDDGTGEIMDLAQIVEGLDAGLAAAELDRIDLLGFDACLMATYEVASALQPYADYLLSSAELEPGHGWDYTSLQAAVDDPAIDALGLGTAFVDGFSTQADAFGTGLDITLSLVDLNQMPALDEAMATFAGQLQDNVDALGPLIGRQRASGIEYGRSPNPAQNPGLTDLGVFVAEIGIASLQVSDAADAVLRAINDAVVHQTVGPARLGSTGLSIYFPPTPDLIDPAYAAVGGADAWLAFIDAYHGAGSAIPPEAQPALVADAAPSDVGVAQGEATVVEVEGGVEVSIQLDPATLENIASASLSFGYVDPEDGAIVQLGDTEAEVFDDGTVVGFSDLTVLTMTDAVDDTIDAYLSLQFDDEAGLSYASVPLEYTDQSTGDVDLIDLAIVIDSETGDVLQETYYQQDPATGSYGELVADPEALISPLVLVFYPDGTSDWESYGDTALFADLPEIQYDLAELEAGTLLYVDIVVTDFGGNQVIAAATFTQQ